MIRDTVRRFRSRCLRFLSPISAASLRARLDELIPSSVPLLFVHSSLSSCGRFTAGANDVLDALAERAVTIGFPTHTYCYPERADELGPVFDMASTPSHNGMLTEMFRHRPGVVRSIHSTHSLAFCGPRAEKLCAGHYLASTPCGAGTPYERMVQNDASVLMFGVTFHSYTLFHTAEDASGSPCAYEKGTLDRLRVLDESGAVRDCTSKRQSRDPRRFREMGEHLIGVGLVRQLRLGRNSLMYIPSSGDVHDYLVKQLRNVPDYLYAACRAKLAWFAACLIPVVF